MFRNGLQPSHIIILVLVVILIFGAAKLPDIAANIGKSMKVFKKEVKELRDDDSDTSSYTATGGQPPTDPAQSPYQRTGQGTDQPPTTPPQSQTPDAPGRTPQS